LLAKDQCLASQHEKRNSPDIPIIIFLHPGSFCDEYNGDETADVVKLLTDNILPAFKIMMIWAEME